MSNSGTKLTKIKQFVVPFLFFFTLAILLTLPLAMHLSTHLPDGTDSLLHYWNGWSVLQALKTGHSPYFTPYLFYPQGLSMVYNNFAWLSIMAWVGAQKLVGGVAAYNLIFIINLALCGLAAWWLAYELTGFKKAALLAGLVYEAWPYRLTQPSHPNMMSTWAIPIFLLFLHRLIQNKRWQDGVWAGLALALVGYTRWQLLIPAVMIGGLYVLVTLPLNWGRITLLGLLLSGLVAGILLAPPMILLAIEWQRNPADLFIEGEEISMQTDVLAYLTPAGSHPIFGRWTQSLYEAVYYPDRDSRSSFSPYIGFLTLLLAIWGIWKGSRSSTLPWVLITLVLWGLALGPTIRIIGHQYTTIPTLYDLAEHFVFVRLLREPDRFNMFLALPIAMLTAYGTQKLPFINKDQWQSTALLILLGGIILFEYLAIPMPLQSATVSSIYTQLGEEQGEFAILNIPVNPFKSKPYMFAQTTHQHPILQGHSSRYPLDAFNYLQNNTWLNGMLKFDQFPPLQFDISRQLKTLSEDDIRYLILNKDLISFKYWHNWQNYFAMEPRYEDEEIIVYATNPEAGRDFMFINEAVPGTGIIRTLLSSSCLNADSVLSVGVAWGTAVAPERDFLVKIAINSSEHTDEYGETFPINEWPSNEWEENTILWSFYTLSAPQLIPDGTHNITLTLLDPATQEPVSEPVTLGVIQRQTTPCSPTIPAQIQPINALFGNDMRLSGYQVNIDGKNLNVTLYWHSEQRMTTDYKVFVHLFDPLTGIPAAQDDSMPRQWSYPTTFWWPGELLDDQITISIQDVPSGKYGIAVGVYDPATGERLPISPAKDLNASDGRLILPEVEINSLPQEP